MRIKELGSSDTVPKTRCFFVRFSHFIIFHDFVFSNTHAYYSSNIIDFYVCKNRILL